MSSKTSQVHVVFKTHLDIGYTDLAQHVVERYLNVFIPKAIANAEYFEANQEKGSFIWTTGSWLIHYVLKYGTKQQQQQVETAIQKGYLKWHGLPFTTYTELLDPELLEYGISMSTRLDQQFGTRTIAAKMTDVPGHTRSMITQMANAGIKYLHLGVNASSHVPHVPQLFLWRNQDGTEIVVQYSKDYGDTIQVEGLEDILYFAHTHDNHGPSSVEQIEQEFKKLEEIYPNASIQASTLDQFADKVWAIRHTLPVVDEEIGDSWIHGSSTDPFKLAAYRELLRLKNKWLAEGSLSTMDDEYQTFLDELIMVAEHTWGVDIKRYLADYAHYDKEDFKRARQQDKVDVRLNPLEYRFYEHNSTAEIHEMFGDEAKNKLEARSYSLMERSWQEQREYVSKAIAKLHPSRQQEAEAALLALKPVRCVFSHDAKLLVPEEAYPLGRFQVVFAEDGSIIGLTDSKGKAWADALHPIGLFVYETYSQEDYDRWYRQYHVRWKHTHVWATGDFGKPGMDLTQAWIRHETFTPKLKTLHYKQEEGADIVYAVLHMPKQASERLGAAREITVEYRFSTKTETIEYKLQWFDKDAYRLPESSWVTFNPRVGNPYRWKLDKLGQLISPHEVVQGGNRNMHAVNKGVCYHGADGKVSIDILDAALVCPGERRLLQFDHTFASPAGGMHVNLHNNVWGTNFPAWYEEDAAFRFKLQFHSYQ